MKIPNAAPGEGARYDHDWFNNWGVGGGERHPAYYAGGTQWFVVHPSDRGTKPCLHWMTRGALPCRFCGAQKVPCQVGYVPLFRAVDYRPLFVIVYEEEREWVEKLALHDRVLVGREKDSGARVWVRKCLEQEPRFQTSLARRLVAQDLTPSLLRLWKLPELVAWLAARSDNAVSQQKTEPVKSDGEPFSPMTARAVERYAPPPDDAGASSALFDEVKNRIKERTANLKPSANGKHKPKG